MLIFESLTAGWINDNVGLFFLLKQFAERGNIMRLGGGLPTVVGIRTGTWPKVITRLKDWVVAVRLDNGRSQCWGRPPRTWCVSDCGGIHQVGGGGLVGGKYRGHNCHPRRKCSWGKVGHPWRRFRKIWLDSNRRCGESCHGSRSCWGNGSDVGENAGQCLYGGELIFAQSCKWYWSGTQESLGKCAGGSGGGACGAAGWDGAIVREKLDIFGGMFGAGPQNVDAVISVVVRGGSKIPTVDILGDPGATIAGCFVDNDAFSGGC